MREKSRVRRFRPHFRLCAAPGNRPEARLPPAPRAPPVRAAPPETGTSNRPANRTTAIGARVGAATPPRVPVLRRQPVLKERALNAPEQTTDIQIVLLVAG